MNYYALSGLINGITSSVLGVFVYTRNKKDIRYITFGLFCLSISVWSCFYFLWQISTDHDTALLCSRGLMMGAIFIPAFYLHNVLAILGKLDGKRKILIFYYLVSGIFFIANFTPLFVKDVIPRLIFPYWPLPGIFLHLHLLMFGLTILYLSYLLFEAYFTGTGLYRTQMLYMFIAIILGFGGGMTNYFLWYNIPVKPYANIFVSFSVTMIAYAIAKHRLMDINLVLRYTTIYSLFAIIFSTPFILAIWLVRLSSWSYLIVSIAVVASPYLFSRFREQITSTVDLFPLFKEYKKLNELRQYQDRVAEARTEKEWAEKLVVVTDELFSPVSCSVLVYEKIFDGFCLIAGKNLPTGNLSFSLGIGFDSPLVKYLQEEKSLIAKELIDGRKETELIKQEMSGIAAEISIPFFVSGKLTAILNLSNREDGKLYNDLTIKSLWALGRTAEEVLRSIINKIRVKHMSDIGKLAHDLLKPFGFKGSKPYLESMQGGECGELNEQQKKAIKVINDDYNFLEKYMKFFLKIASGEQEEIYAIEPNSLTECYQRLEEKFKAEAKKQGIKLVVNKPAPELKVRCDLQAIEYRVIFNLMDNAFRYTSEGGTIELGYELKDGLFVGRVKDSGKGIAKENLEKIFEQGFQIEDGKKGLAGLGLAIIREVMDAHKGEVWAESDGEGKGTTFYFSMHLTGRTTI